METLSKYVQQMLSAGHPPVVLCSPQIRLAFRRFFETTFADWRCSHLEIPAGWRSKTRPVIRVLQVNLNAPTD
jgi:flagellar biosynthesis component FlhA